MCSSSGVQNCITQPLVSSHLQVWWYQRHKINLLQKNCGHKLFNYWDKYTEMHGQQNVKKCYFICPQKLFSKAGTISYCKFLHFIATRFFPRNLQLAVLQCTAFRKLFCLKYRNGWTFSHILMTINCELLFGVFIFFITPFFFRFAWHKCV